MEKDLPDMRGMTINERLFASGKMALWDDALERRSREDLINIMISLQLSEHEANWTVDQALNRTALGKTSQSIKERLNQTHLRLPKDNPHS